MKKYLFFLLLALSNTLGAQEINFTTQEFPKEASFAQPFDVHLEVSHTPGYTPKLDEESVPEGFEMISQNAQTLSPGTAAYDITLMPFTLGVSTFTALSVDLLDHAATQVAKAQIQEARITIKPVKFFKDNTLQDIRPPYIPMGWLGWLICLLLIGLLIYLSRHSWEKVQAKRAAAKEQDLRPADVIALSKIQMLLQSGLWENAHYKLFYIELEEIFKEYLWRRFHLDTSADTSVELLRRVRKEPLLESFTQLLREYLASSDLVKFAKVTPDQTIMQRDVQTVQLVVKKTPPTPQAAPSSKQEAGK